MRVLFNIMTRHKEIVNCLDEVVGILGEVDEVYTSFQPTQNWVFTMRDLVDIARILQEENTGKSTTIQFKPLGE